MGEAKAKQLKAREEALAKSRFCIFCGGHSLATEGDHVPPRSLFVQRRWPEGYVFPACNACNAGSRESDRIVAFLSRIHPEKSEFSENPIAKQEVFALFRALKGRNQNLLRSMFNVTSLEKKNLASRIGIPRPDGTLYRDFPFLKVPREVRHAIEEFSIKTAKALHFHHTGQIVPSEASIKIRLYTNVHRLEGRIPEEVFTIPQAGPLLHREKVALNDQFKYRYAVSDDFTSGIYTISCQFSFVVVVFLVFNPQDWNDIYQYAEPNDLG